MTTFRLVDGFGPPSPRDYRLTRSVLVAHMGHVRGWFLPVNDNQPLNQAGAQLPDGTRAAGSLISFHDSANSAGVQHDVG